MAEPKRLNPKAKRKGAKRPPPVVDRAARAELGRVWEFLEDVADENQKLWNSLLSAWVEIEFLKNGREIKRMAEETEAELGIE